MRGGLVSGTIAGDTTGLSGPPASETALNSSGDTVSVLPVRHRVGHPIDLVLATADGPTHRRAQPTLAGMVRGHRLEGGLTQAALARRAGVSARTIQNIERGVAWPRQATAERLADALGLDGP